MPAGSWFSLDCLPRVAELNDSLSLLVPGQWLLAVSSLPGVHRQLDVPSATTAALLPISLE